MSENLVNSNLNSSTEGKVFENEIVIKNDYFHKSIETDGENYKELYEKEKIINKNLTKKIEDNEKKILELLKSLNEILKLNKTDTELNKMDSNEIDEIRNKITSIMYRELRLKHIVPFSPYISNFNYNLFSKNISNKM